MLGLKQPARGDVKEKALEAVTQTHIWGMKRHQIPRTLLTIWKTRNMLTWAACPTLDTHLSKQFLALSDEPVQALRTPRDIVSCIGAFRPLWPLQLPHLSPSPSHHRLLPLSISNRSNSRRWHLNPCARHQQNVNRQQAERWRWGAMSAKLSCMCSYHKPPIDSLASLSD